MASSSSRRVAVVAVHGVADQQPGDTSTAIANLLSNLNDKKAPAYPSFTSEEIRIPVRPLRFPEREEYRTRDLKTWAVDRRTGRRDAALGGDAPDAGLEFMKSLVSNYKPSGGDEMYETVVRRGSRRLSDGATQVVDIYEMYWADLSRLSQSWVRIFAEIYQLMFHLGSLGVHAIRAAEGSEAGPSPAWHWKWWGGAQRFAANVLAQPILILNLCLAALMLVLPAAIVSTAVAQAVVWGVSGALAIVAIGLVTYRAYARTTSVKRRGLSLFALAIALVALLIWRKVPDSHAPHVFATILAGLAALAVTAIVKSYDKFRPGTWALMQWPCAAVLAWFLIELWIRQRTGQDAVLHSAMHTAELVFVALRMLWIGFLVAAVVAFAIGEVVVWSSKADDAGKDRLSRVRWTARLTLVLPAILFLLVTIVLWGALWPAVVKQAPFAATEHRRYDLTAYLIPDLDDALAKHQKQGANTVDDLVRAFISNASGAAFLALLASLAVSLLMGLYAVAPSVLGEIRPPSVPRDGTRSGRWLDGGFRLLRWGGRFMVVVVLLGMPLASWFAPDGIKNSSEGALWWAAATLGVAGGGLMLFRDRLKSVTLGLRGALDVALDVDNYLRENPRESNPRGRIAARMASLLKHVYEGHYNAVVIIAHSQGTVIAADLLRLIKSSELDRPGGDLAARGGTLIYFFTMGSPLRQLYGLRFPHLYQWARHHVTAHWTRLDEPIDAKTRPDPAELGVRLWVNAYRSGDYVGRYLWRPEQCDFAYETTPVADELPWQAGPTNVPASTTAATPPNRREFCIGSGGHQHYWDHTAPHIAMELDNLITLTETP